MKTFKIFGGFWGQNNFFWYISENRFSKQFSLKIFFCFLLSTPKRLETFVKCVKKCVTAKIYPIKVRILQIIIFKVTLRTILAIFPKVWDHITKTVFFKFLFLVLSFWKRIALVYFLKTDWSYTFLKVENSN